jgi:anti-anti-sigma regulatory factor
MTKRKAHTVKLAEDIGLRSAQAIASQLKAALEKHETITLDTRAATVADLTTIQALLAARKQADAAGKSIQLSAPLGDCLRHALETYGCLTATGEPTSGAVAWLAGSTQGGT